MKLAVGPGIGEELFSSVESILMLLESHGYPLCRIGYQFDFNEHTILRKLNYKHICVIIFPVVFSEH